MYDKIVTALEPFGLTMVVIAGLILDNRVQVANHDIVGVIVVLVGVALIINHVVKQVRQSSSNKSK
jgi:energy-converting hydrogenase Eha subunit C